MLTLCFVVLVLMEWVSRISGTLSAPGEPPGRVFLVVLGVESARRSPAIVCSARSKRTSASLEDASHTRTARRRERGTLCLWRLVKTWHCCTFRCDGGDLFEKTVLFASTSVSTESARTNGLSDTNQAIVSLAAPRSLQQFTVVEKRLDSQILSRIWSFVLVVFDLLMMSRDIVFKSLRNFPVSCFIAVEFFSPCLLQFPVFFQDVRVMF